MDDLRRRVYKFSKGLFVVCVIFSCIVACAKHSAPSPPLVLPFSLEKTGTKLATEIRIVDRREYIYVLRFLYKEGDQLDRARVRRLVGGYEVDRAGKPLEPGVPTPVRLRIVRLNPPREAVIYNEELPQPVLVSWGVDSFDRHLAYVVLEPGTYRVELTNLRESPEFNQTSIALGIGYYHKP